MSRTQTPLSSSSTPNPYVNSAASPPPPSKPSAPNPTISKTAKPIETEKKQNEEALNKKREFADRFKNRRKRPLPTEDIKSEGPNNSKKVKADKEISQYEREVKQYKGNGNLKDDGMGVRPLVK